MSETSPAMHKEILALSQQAGFLRAGQPGEIQDGLARLEASLYTLSRQVAAYEDERGHLLALAGIGEVINSSLELDEVLRIVMDTIVRLTNAERGFLMLRDEQGQMATRVARNWEQESINPSESAVSRTVMQRVIESGQAVLTTNAQEDPRFGGQESIVAFNMRSILCVPLKVKNDLIGVIYADNRIRSGIFTEAERGLLDAFANQAAVAIENARLFASLRHTLAEVTELKNLMDNVFASIASGVITADVQDQITLCNRAAGAILGRPSIEVIGRRLDEVLPGLADDLLPQLGRVRAQDKPIDMELIHQDPQRGALDWRFNLSPLKDADQSTQGVAIVLDDLTERKQLEAQRRLLERMLSPAVLAQMDLDSLQIGGKRSEITILFADVRGFTSFSEKQTPEQLVAVLNRYLAAGAEAVLSQEGTVDKFLGDAVMAWFNAPIPQPDHTLRAVRAALAIREAVERLHTELPGEAHLSFGVGIHTGEAVLGWIGTERRQDYTAIGDSVNTAKRIQENTTPGQILLSASAYELVRGQVRAERMDRLTVKGKSQPVEVYLLEGLK